MCAQTSTPPFTHRFVRSVFIACVGTAFLCGSPSAAAQDAVVDQANTGGASADGAFNECCIYLAQTFIAGRDGILAGVNIDTRQGDPSLPPSPTRVSIRNTVGSIPGETVLATTVVPSSDNPLSELITFPQRVVIHAGVKYALVVNLEDPNARSSSWSGTGNTYPRGEQCARFRPGIVPAGQEWFCYSEEFGYPEFAWFDLRFRTYLAPRAPATRAECKNGGWRNYGTTFKNQGDCVSFINHQARQECTFILAAIGRAAFRSEYGYGTATPHAMRRCVRQRSDD